MKKLNISIKKRPINVILLFCVSGLYFINNHYFKNYSSGNIQLFFICYFNDLLCPLFFFSYSNLLLLTIDKELCKIKSICIVGICVSLIWEFFAPLIKPSSTTDLIDIICYMIGSITYWGITRYMYKKNEM